MTEGDEELSPQELRQQELAEIWKYAQEQAENGFVWVYRGEGEADQSLAGPNAHTGAWFTTSFEHAQSHVLKMEERGAKGTRIIVAALPRIMVDRDEQIRRRGGRMPIGTDTVLVPFRNDLIERIITAPIAEDPTPDIYVNQFRVAQEDGGNSRSSVTSSGGS